MLLKPFLLLGYPFYLLSKKAYNLITVQNILTSSTIAFILKDLIFAKWYK